MGLRETFEKLAIDFAYELVALVRRSRPGDVPTRVQRRRGRPRGKVLDAATKLAHASPSFAPESRLRVPAEPRHADRDHLPSAHGDPLSGTRDAAPNDSATLEPAAPMSAATVAPFMAALPKLHRSSEIRVPAEKRQVLFDDLPLSVRLYNALSRNGYVVLGDLEGRTLGYLLHHRGFGKGCQKDLRYVLLELGIVPVLPEPTVFQVPAFAHAYRFDDLVLSRRARWSMRRGGLATLGDLHNRATSDRLLANMSKRDHGEITSMIEAMAAAGFPEPGGLLDHLDLGLDRLGERQREVLLLRFGGAGEEPLTLEAIAPRIGVTRERVRQVQELALEKLRVVAGPELGKGLRELEARLSAEGAEVATELEGSWRAKGPSTDPWADDGFYLRLLAKLVPRIRATDRHALLHQAAFATIHCGDQHLATGDDADDGAR